MESILKNSEFAKDYEKLKNVSLNPEKHFAKNAFEHTEMVAKRALELAELNNFSQEEKEIIQNLAYVHDIGKILGTANPEKSLELLPKYGEFDKSFVNLVRHHDTNLPWHNSFMRGEAPSEKAWKKIAGKVNMKILCLFMIADRADCPGGWKTNKPLNWFLDEAKKRRLIDEELKTE